ncbi:uncharacterized protein LOC119360548 [Triticum dicoccoides]|uniref:uncharacterized protein LOC119360548 n=1 Tax=Triticum dicoccoides TaxID=85692 RepID=UPI00188E5A89|nr:uncharacterized protein LOC119360548 [Triticum dicoccoides]
MALRAALLDGHGRPRLLVALFPGDGGQPCLFAAAVLDRHGQLVTAVLVRRNAEKPLGHGPIRLPSLPPVLRFRLSVPANFTAGGWPLRLDAGVFRVDPVIIDASALEVIFPQICTPTPLRPPRVPPRAPRGHSTDNSTRPPSLVPCTRPGNEDLLLPAQLLQLLLKNGGVREHGNFKQYNVEAGFEMGELGSWASDDELVKMEAGYLPHRCRDDSFEDSETSELLISKLSSLVGEIYRDLPENLQKKLGDEVRRAAEQPADNSGQAKGWMWGTFLSSVCVSLASHLAMFLMSALWPRSESVKEESAVSSPAPSATEKNIFLRWGVEKVIGPFLICVALTVIRKFIISKEIWKKSYKANEMVNLWINTFAKGTFFAVKEFPVTRGGLELWAHLASFAIELLGATWLLWRFGFWESDVVDS